MNNEELHKKLGDDYTIPCSKLTYEADRLAAKQRILERRFSEQIFKTPIMMQASGVADRLNLIKFFFDTQLILYYFIAL